MNASACQASGSKNAANSRLTDSIGKGSRDGECFSRGLIQSFAHVTNSTSPSSFYHILVFAFVDVLHYHM